ncbi:unnamed protein product, partial [Didymodactylos carnosus]
RVKKYITGEDSVSTIISQGLFKPTSIYVICDDQIYILDSTNDEELIERSCIVKLWTTSSNEGRIIAKEVKGSICYNLYLDLDRNIYLSTENDVRKWFAPTLMTVLVCITTIRRNAPYKNGCITVQWV